MEGAAEPTTENHLVLEGIMKSPFSRVLKKISSKEGVEEKKHTPELILSKAVETSIITKFYHFKRTFVHVISITQRIPEREEPHSLPLFCFIEAELKLEHSH